MTDWKDFKNWLDKNIVEIEGLAVKVKNDKQSKYGEISTKILTDFCDSLEATLDKNSVYHLFPALTENAEFRELFSINECYFGKKTNREAIKVHDYQVLEKLFNDWKDKRGKRKERTNAMIRKRI